MARKCCICCPLGRGIALIGIYTALEAIFYCGLMIGSGAFWPLKMTAFSFKTLLCLSFILVRAMPKSLMSRVWLYIFWIVDMCIAILLISLVFKQVSGLNYYDEYCIQSREENQPGFWQPGPNGRMPFFTDVDQCSELMRATNRLGLLLVFITYIPIRVWLAWNLKDWYHELRERKEEELRDFDPYDY